MPTPGLSKPSLSRRRRRNPFRARKFCPGPLISSSRNSKRRKAVPARGFRHSFFRHELAIDPPLRAGILGKPNGHGFRRCGRPASAYATIPEFQDTETARIPTFWNSAECLLLMARPGPRRGRAWIRATSPAAAAGRCACGRSWAAGLPTSGRSARSDRPTCRGRSLAERQCRRT